MYTFIKTSQIKFFAVACAIAAMPACGLDDEVAALPESVDRSTRALILGDILELNGSYGAGCKNRSGSWSIALATLETQTNPSLSVMKNNSACVLTLQTIRIGDDEGSAISYETGSNISLGSSYKVAGSAFKQQSQMTTKFYANARMEPDASFSSNFVLRFLYSDDPTAASAAQNATYIFQSSSAMSANVPAPDYTASAAGVTLNTDAEDIVESVSGSVALTDVSVSGDMYVVSNTDLSGSPTYAAIDEEYLAGTPTALVGPNPTIAASAFNLVGADVTDPVKRSLIIAKIDNGNRSYQVITLTFNHG